MPDQTDPARALLRRAYGVDGGGDAPAGLLDEVHRAASGPADPRPIELRPDRPAPRPHGHRPPRRRGGLVMAGAVAAAMLVVLSGATIATRLLGAGGGAPVGGRPSTLPSVIASPGGSPASTVTAGPVLPVPSQCAVAWELALQDRSFSVSDRDSGCPPLAVDGLYLVDVAEGNGRFEPGFATVWPITPAGAAGPTITAPFTFTAAGWPGRTPGHFYEIWYSASVRPPAGSDAMSIYEHALTISAPLLAK
ncbi:hypothetical protein [Dactylosporangium sp. CA-092794]|uniref:hypothetical protein n=1 Tax=Dactylosporangium sp. CA-092794 TaxID=3239929 RepID=UPI003D8D9BA6